VVGAQREQGLGEASPCLDLHQRSTPLTAPVVQESLEWCRHACFSLRYHFQSTTIVSEAMSAVRSSSRPWIGGLHHLG
jgi:hypothetical protein